MTQQKKEIITIIFDIDSDARYADLKALEKIELIKNRIIDVCKILTIKNPNATWIIAWREYGIYERNKNSISNKIKKCLKNEMRCLSSSYPNLIIIAGTVLTRTKKPISYVNHVKEHYKKLAWIQKAEKNEIERQMENHVNEVEAIAVKTKNNKGSTIRVTTNKARLYFHGKEKRHGKAAPFRENFHIPGAIYQPGKNNNLNPVITIQEPPLDISIGIEICREHADKIHFLKYRVEDKKNSQKPLLHFVISNTIDLDLNSLCAKLGAIHVDSQESLRLILSRDYQDENTTIKLYRCKVMESIKQLNDIITPEYPHPPKTANQIAKEKPPESMVSYATKMFYDYVKIPGSFFDVLSKKKRKLQQSRVDKAKRVCR